MNIDLILRVLLDNEDFYLLASEELVIQSIKLKMYYEEINKLEEETILRLIALKEIEKSKKIPRQNYMTLEEEINQLSLILEMYSYRKNAINIELKNYFNVLNTKDIKKHDIKIYKQKLEKLLFITDGIIDIKEIDKFEDIKIKITILEIFCERYCYQNKNKITDILFILDKLSNKVQSDIRRNSEIYYHLNEVLDLEKILTLYFDYGFNLINKDVMKRLYNIKFDILMDNIKNNEVPIRKDDYGYTYYEEIISEGIEDLIMGRNKQIHDLFSNTFDSFFYEKLLINNIKKIFILNNMFNCEEILSNIIKLRFFMITRNIYRFYHQTTLKELKEIYEFEEPGIIWHESVKLENAFTYVTNDNPIFNNPIYKIYKSLYSVNYIDYIKGNYRLPEGIIEIDFNKIGKSNYNYFKGKCNRVDLYLPSSLKKIIYGNFFKDANVCKVYINEDLEEFKLSEKTSIMINIINKENTNFRMNNKFINHIVIPETTKLFNIFNRRENICNLYDFYFIEPDDTCLFAHLEYCYCIPRFNYLSFMKENANYDATSIEKYISGKVKYPSCYYRKYSSHWTGEEVSDMAYRRTMLMLYDIFDDKTKKNNKL